MEDEHEHEQERSLSFLEILALPVYYSMKWFGDAAVIFIIPYWIALTIIGSAIVIGGVLGTVFALFYLVIG